MFRFPLQTFIYGLEVTLSTFFERTWKKQGKKHPCQCTSCG